MTAAQTAFDPRRVALAKLAIARDDLARTTAPFGRGRYTDAQRETALVNLEAAVAECKALGL